MKARGIQNGLDLSIIIINYNTNKLTSDCIDSIKSSDVSMIDYEIIVIDNASPIEDPEKLKVTFPEIQLIKSDENLGFGRANNLGIDIAKGKYILLLNSDTIVLEGCISKCIDFLNSEFAKSENIGLIGCNVLNDDKTNQYSVFGEHDPFTYFITSNPILSRFYRSSGVFDFDKTQQVSGVSGCFMLFDADVFINTKSFDPDFFMYSEESDLCRNRISKWYKIFYFSEASIIHLGGKSSPTSKAMIQNMLSYALYRYKIGLMDYTLYLIATLFNMLSIIVCLPALLIFNKKSRVYELKSYLHIIPYLLFDIPRFSRKWGGRKRCLKFK